MKLDDRVVYKARVIGRDPKILWRSTHAKWVAWMNRGCVIRESSALSQGGSYGLDEVIDPEGLFEERGAAASRQ